MVAHKNPRPIGFGQSPVWFEHHTKNDYLPRAGYYSPGTLMLGDMELGPYIRSLAPKTTKTVKVLKFLSKWGRNAGPFGIVYNIYRLHKGGFKYWMKVRKAAKAVVSYSSISMKLKKLVWH